MRKINKIAYICLLSLPFSLSGCRNVVPEEPIICNEHIDNDHDNFCDICYTNLIKTFNGLVFESQNFYYDGKAHSLTVQNVPSFAKVTYTNNNKTAVGTYTVTAVVSAEGYKNKTLTAVMQILQNEFKNITFEDEFFAYDGKNHSIYAQNVPSFATVTYSNNNQYTKGSYEVTATIKATGYKTLVLKATMTIASVFDDYKLPNYTFIYNGKDHELNPTFNNLPRYTDIAYKVDGKTVETPTVKTVGKHSFEVTLTNTEYKYIPMTIASTINVINPSFCGTDKSVEPFQITSDLKFQELKNEILKGNFTVEAFVEDDYFYPDGTTRHTSGEVVTTYVADGEMFSYSSEYSTFIHSKIVGDDVLVSEYEDGGTPLLTKMDADLFEENFVVHYGLQCLAYLSEGDNGEIKEGQLGGYVTAYGAPTIDIENNYFYQEVRWHYFHNEFNHDEIVIYRIRNIGNTVINQNSDIDLTKFDYDKFVYYKFVKDGFDYILFDEGFRVNVSFNSLDVLYLDKKSYVLPATYKNMKINEIDYDYYDSRYKLDLTGYEIHVYFDKDGYYQGQYSSLGYVKGANNLVYHFRYYGGTVKYYGEW